MGLSGSSAGIDLACSFDVLHLDDLVVALVQLVAGDVVVDPPGTQDQPLVNWAGNYRYSTDKLVTLDSVEKVRSYVRDHDSMRALGTRHCFNGIADSPHALLSLKPMDRVVSLDAAERLATWLGAEFEPFGAHSHYGLILGEEGYTQVADGIRGFLEAHRL
jgi:hypothetical protein